MSNDQGFPEATQPGQKPIINSIWDFSDAALGQLRLWLEQNPPAIGISNVLGFSQFTVQAATQIATSETTTSTTYTDLATTGPTLTGLPDGKYLVWYGAAAASSVVGIGANLSVQVNSTAATDTDIAGTDGGNFVTVNRPVTKTLSNGNNTLTVKYRVGGAATGTFANRWLLALRYANK